VAQGSQKEEDGDLHGSELRSAGEEGKIPLLNIRGKKRKRESFAYRRTCDFSSFPLFL
jgi:hypothetical protein